mgnify:FL=1
MRRFDALLNEYQYSGRPKAAPTVAFESMSLAEEKNLRCDKQLPLRMSVHGRPRFAKLSVHGDMKVRLHPYIRTFAAASPLSLMGFAGQLLYRFVALKVLRTFWASLTTV